MQPNNQNIPQQQPNPKYTGAWDFLNTPEQPPKKPSFFDQNKKLVIISALAMVLLLVLSVVAIISAPEQNQNNSVNGPTTDVPLTVYSGQLFSMSYASTMTIQTDEATEDPLGWFLNFSDNIENPSYDLSVEVNNQYPSFIDGADAIANLVNVSGEGDKEVSRVSIGGVETDKTTIKTTNNFGEESVAVYAGTQVGNKYVSIYGKYPKNNLDIANSFDAMAGSIKVN